MFTSLSGAGFINTVKSLLFKGNDRYNYPGRRHGQNYPIRRNRQVYPDRRNSQNYSEPAPEQFDDDYEFTSRNSRSNPPSRPRRTRKSLIIGGVCGLLLVVLVVLCIYSWNSWNYASAELQKYPVVDNSMVVTLQARARSTRNHPVDVKVTSSDAEGHSQTEQWTTQGNTVTLEAELLQMPESSAHFWLTPISSQNLSADDMYIKDVLNGTNHVPGLTTTAVQCTVPLDTKKMNVYQTFKILITPDGFCKVSPRN